MTTVFCGGSAERKEERINDYLSVIRLPFPDVALRAYWFQLWNCSFLRRSLGHFDIVHAINPQSSAICAFVKPIRAALISTMHEIPRFRSKAFFDAPLRNWTLREFLSSFLETPMNEYLYKVCFRESSKIISVGHFTLEEAKVAFRPFPIAKATVIPNGIDFERIDKEKRGGSEGLATDADILFYGRLAWVKGVVHLLEAARSLKNDFPSIKIKVIGTGPLLDRLRTMVHVSGLSHNVDFLGHLASHDSVVAEIARSSIVALPSIYEANSIGLLEAMACRKPIVAFDYPFTREVLKDGYTGLLARPRDSKDLSNKIGMLLDDRRLRKSLGDNAYQHVLKEHNWERLADKYVELYRQL